MSTIIALSMVPTILTTIIIVVIIALCFVLKRWLIEYKLKLLAVSSTKQYIKQLQEQIKRETRPEILEELIKLMTIASERLLNPDNASLSSPVLTSNIQTLDHVSTLTPSVSTDANHGTHQTSIVVDGSAVETKINLGSEEANTQTRRVSFRRHLSMEKMEMMQQLNSIQRDQLTTLFAEFLSNAVHGSLVHASEHNPGLAVKVEKGVKRAMLLRQQSLGVSYGECEFTCSRYYGRSVSENVGTKEVDCHSFLRQNTVI